MRYDDFDDPTTTSPPAPVAGDLRWWTGEPEDMYRSQAVRVLGVSTSGRMVAVEALTGEMKGDCWFASPASLADLGPVEVTLRIPFDQAVAWLEDGEPWAAKTFHDPGAMVDHALAAELRVALNIPSGGAS